MYSERSSSQAISNLFRALFILGESETLQLLHELRDLSAQMACLSRRMLDHSGISLSDLIHDANGCADFSYTGRLIASRGCDLSDERVHRIYSGNDVAQRVAGAVNDGDTVVNLPRAFAYQ